eukprot:ANDGO_02980.mRNA.1 putative serine/threonine-protein kinase DDB_G0268078
MNKYRLLGKKGEGTFSEVLKAQSTKNSKYVAIKCMKNRFESIEQVNRLREIQALRRLSPHPNIVKLYEVLYDRPTGRLALVFELMDMNVYELIRGRRHYLPEEKIRLYMYQLLKSMDHMHRNGIFHRDIKPENILITEDQLKLADFGSCRGIYSKQPFTEYISTRWYRAPECLLTDGYYNYKMDMWGVGCVFFEILSLYPLFPGTNELDQIHKIHNICGTPPPDLLEKFKRLSSHIDFNFPAKEGTGIDKLLSHASPLCVDLIKSLLAYNPDERFSARQALRHEYFRDLREAEKRMRAKQRAANPNSTRKSDAGSEVGSPRGMHTPKSMASEFHHGPGGRHDDDDDDDWENEGEPAAHAVGSGFGPASLGVAGGKGANALSSKAAANAAGGGGGGAGHTHGIPVSGPPPGLAPSGVLRKDKPSVHSGGFHPALGHAHGPAANPQGSGLAVVSHAHGTEHASGDVAINSNNEFIYGSTSGSTSLPSIGAARKPTHANAAPPSLTNSGSFGGGTGLSTFSSSSSMQMSGSLSNAQSLYGNSMMGTTASGGGVSNVKVSLPSVQADKKDKPKQPPPRIPKPSVQTMHMQPAASNNPVVKDRERSKRY